MKIHKAAIIEQDLQQIADMLLLNGTLTECPGLVHGKMGIAIFFFHYARYTSNTLLSDYALDLIEKIQYQIHANSRGDYEKGIAGLGTGIDYLIQNNFLEVEDDIFEDLDNRMYRAVMHDPWQDFSLYDGLTGYGKYWLLRLRRQPLLIQAEDCLMRITEQIEEKCSDIPIEEQIDVYCFLHDLHKIPGIDVSIRLLEQIQKQSVNSGRCFSRLGDSSIKNTIQKYQQCQYFNDTLQSEVEISLMQIPNLDMKKCPTGMGLLTGYAGEGLLRLAALDPTSTSWMNLL